MRLALLAACVGCQRAVDRGALGADLDSARAIARRADAFAAAVASDARTPAASDSSGVSPGLLGRSLDDVQRSAFFAFYHLQPTTVERHGGDTTVTFYRPAGGPFQSRTEVAVASAGGHVFELALTLARSFVDDPGNGKYARDIALSFARSAPPAGDDAYTDVESDADDYRALVAALGQRGAADTSLAYRVFAGTAGADASVSALSSTGMFGVDPDSLAGEPAVVLSFTSSARVAGGLTGLAGRARARTDTSPSPLQPSRRP